MSELYIRIENLCKEHKISITAMCKEAMVSRSSITDLKQGRSKTLSSEAISKIAKLFDVSTDYLMTGNEAEPQSSDMDDNIKFALWGTADVDDDVLEDVKHYAQIARQMREDKKNKE